MGNVWKKEKTEEQKKRAKLESDLLQTQQALTALAGAVATVSTTTTASTGGNS